MNTPVPPDSGSFPAAAAAAVRACTRELLAGAQRVARRINAEAVHDTRVASRRLRAALDAFTGAAPIGRRRTVKELRALTRGLGWARELDVSVQLLRGLYASARDTERAALEVVIARLERKRASRKAAAAIDAGSLRRLVRGLESFAAQIAALPDTTAAADVDLAVAEAARAVSGRIDGIDGRGDAEGLHRLRIDVKKLRYAVEISALRDEAAATAVARLKSLQDALGEHNDLAVVERALQQGRARFRRRGHTTLARGIARSLSRMGARRRARHRAAIAAARSLAGDPFLARFRVSHAPAGDAPPA